MTDKQWPDHITFGPIRYAKSDNYDGFYLADAMHGIPTFGSVSPTDPVTIRGQHVRVFNYPRQTEAIAAQLVHRWNNHADLVDALKGYMSLIQSDYETRGGQTGGGMAETYAKLKDLLERAK